MTCKNLRVGVEESAQKTVQWEEAKTCKEGDLNRTSDGDAHRKVELVLAGDGDLKAVK